MAPTPHRPGHLPTPPSPAKSPASSSQAAKSPGASDPRAPGPSRPQHRKPTRRRQLLPAGHSRAAAALLWPVRYRTVKTVIFSLPALPRCRHPQKGCGRVFERDRTPASRVWLVGPRLLTGRARALPLARRLPWGSRRADPPACKLSGEPKPSDAPNFPQAKLPGVLGFRLPGVRGRGRFRRPALVQNRER